MRSRAGFLLPTLFLAAVLGSATEAHGETTWATPETAVVPAGFTAPRATSVVFEVSISDLQVLEEDTAGNGATAFLTVTKSPCDPQAVITLDHATRDGTATAATGDYEAASAMGVEIPDFGEFCELDIYAVVVEDPSPEEDENFFVDISNVECIHQETPCDFVVTDSVGEVTIINEDAEVSIGDLQVQEGNSGTTDAVFPVTLEGRLPFALSIDYATADGTATSPEDYGAMEDVITFAAGETAKDIVIAVNGDTTVEPNETFLVDVVYADELPGTITVVDGQGEATIVNDDGAVSIGDVGLLEGNGGTTDALFTVTLSSSIDEEVLVNYATEDGTATTSDRDYEARSGTLTFRPGVTQETIAVPVSGDSTVEANENFFVNLSLPPSQAISLTISDGQGEATIQNDDGTELSINDVSVDEGDEGTTSALVTVSLSQPSDLPVTFRYATVDSTATAASGDYRSAAGESEIPAGQTTRTLDIRVNGDTDVEPDESFFVILSAASGATIADDRGKVDIRNDDELSEIRLVSAPRVMEDEGRAEVTVERIGGGKRAAAVTVSTQDKTATSPDDFIAKSQRLRWRAGETGVKSFSVRIVQDNVVEKDERILIQLSDPEDATLGTPSRLRLVIGDDDAPMELEIEGETTASIKVEEEAGLQVRVTGEDGQPLEGALVVWRVEGNGELESVETRTNSEGVATNALRVGQTPGEVVVTAELRPTGQTVEFVFTVEGNLADLFDETTDPAGDSVAVVLDKSCAAATGAFQELCGYLFASGLSDEEQRQVVKEATANDAAAQGDLSLDLPKGQLRNVGSRLAALRGGATRDAEEMVAVKFSVDFGGAGLSLGTLRSAVRQYRDGAQWFDDRIARALTQDEDSPAPEPEPEYDDYDDGDERLGLFFNGRVSMGDRDRTGREEGFEFESAALTTGIDYRLSNRLIIGGALGYIDTDLDLDDDGGGLDVQGYSLSAYSTYYTDRYYVESVVSYGMNDYSMLRNVDLPQPFQGQTRFGARAEPDSDQLVLNLGVGYDVAFGAASIGGFGRFSYVDAQVDGYTESGAGPFNLAIREQQVESLLGELGLDWSYAMSVSWGVLQPMVRASYFHEFEDDTRLIRGRFVQDIQANEFAISTDRPDRDFFNLGVGFSGTLAHGRSFYVLYDTDLERDDLSIYTLSAGLRLQF